MRALLQSLVGRPRHVFLLDGCGALLTGALLRLLVMPLERVFGAPADSLGPFVWAALAMATYSFGCFALFPHVRAHVRTLLYVIATANALYCVCTLAMVYAQRNLVTPLGVAYFVGESLIVAGVIALEIATTRMLGASDVDPDGARDRER
jgi:hypothetical protein